MFENSTKVQQCSECQAITFSFLTRITLNSSKMLVWSIRTAEESFELTYILRSHVASC